MLILREFTLFGFTLTVLEWSLLAGGSLYLMGILLVFIGKRIKGEDVFDITGKAFMSAGKKILGLFFDILKSKLTKFKKK